MNRRSLLRLCIALGILCGVGCSNVPSMEERLITAHELALNNGWHSGIIADERFPLRFFAPDDLRQARHLTIYLEGDGLAWLSRTTISTNPTPLNPTGLRLAMAQPGGAALYLARPCQYVALSTSECNKKHWTSGRFSSEVVVSINSAISQLKRQYQADTFELVGFSGGAAIASMVAANRNDVVRLFSVAGNLDHRRWTEYHRITPLTDSLNPDHFIERLHSIPQHHWVGEKDSVIPPALIKAYAAQYPANQQPTVEVVPGFDHHCCWANHWPELWQSAQ